MKIATILGSPRKNGNTERALGLFENRVADRHEIYRINIISYDVSGCLGCQSCQKVADRPGCVQRDDGVSILERIMNADLAVYATPLYCWSFSSQMKALIDRHYCMASRDKALLEGKSAALLVTCGGGRSNTTRT